MRITNQSEWWDSLRVITPGIARYAFENGVPWDVEAFKKAYINSDHYQIHKMLEQLWTDLPDNRSIRYGLFPDICDLISEYWVFDE